MLFRSAGALQISLEGLAIAIGNTGVIEGLTILANTIAEIINNITSIFGRFPNVGVGIRNIMWALGLVGLGAWVKRDRLHRIALGVFGRRKETDDLARKLRDQSLDVRRGFPTGRSFTDEDFREYQRRKRDLYDVAIRDEVKKRRGSHRSEKISAELRQIGRASCRERV